MLKFIERLNKLDSIKDNLNIFALIRKHLDSLDGDKNRLILNNKYSDKDYPVEFKGLMNIFNTSYNFSLESVIDEVKYHMYFNYDPVKDELDNEIIRYKNDEYHTYVVTKDDDGNYNNSSDEVISSKEDEELAYIIDTVINAIININDKERDVIIDNFVNNYIIFYRTIMNSLKDINIGNLYFSLKEPVTLTYSDTKITVDELKINGVHLNRKIISCKFTTEEMNDDKYLSFIYDDAETDKEFEVSLKDRKTSDFLVCNTDYYNLDKPRNIKKVAKAFVPVLSMIYRIIDIFITGKKNILETHHHFCIYDTRYNPVLNRYYIHTGELDDETTNKILNNQIELTPVYKVHDIRLNIIKKYEPLFENIISLNILKKKNKFLSLSTESKQVDEVNLAFDIPVRYRPNDIIFDSEIIKDDKIYRLAIYLLYDENKDEYKFGDVKHEVIKRTDIFNKNLLFINHSEEESNYNRVIIEDDYMKDYEKDIEFINNILEEIRENNSETIKGDLSELYKLI